MDFTKLAFTIQSTGKRISNIELRNVVKYLSGAGRIQVSQSVIKLLGIKEQISFSPIIEDKETGKLYQAFFASVPALDKAGNQKVNEAKELMYVASSKVNLLGQYTDSNTSKTVRELVKGVVTDEEKENFDNLHCVFVATETGEEDAKELVYTTIPVNNGVEVIQVKALVMEYLECEEKQR